MQGRLDQESRPCEEGKGKLVERAFGLDFAAGAAADADRGLDHGHRVRAAAEERVTAEGMAGAVTWGPAPVRCCGDRAEAAWAMRARRSVRPLPWAGRGGAAVTAGSRERSACTVKP